ncbi:hypothetical protein [Microvirga lotononidis]|uniref:Uncharacterized protein n=1 Tax=Microvirga lotononidis TaxID=864069 RepID=I4YSZ3_9HYPH|nr:hypothetical protein [Microvirga lotononidis]EIM27085.1 hypothetical protein MicloDRAFT_00036390 [Microvirga lotononidis]WQO28726.1 hypothetical protein U0023_06540 [Microvirga lotononidis]
MPQMIAALFRDHGQARQALQSLLEMGIAQNRIVAAGNAEAREISSISGFRALSARDETLDALHELNLPEADKRLFAQGIHRHCVLIAAQVDRDNVEEALRALEMFDPVDLDASSREWLDEHPSGRAGADAGAPLGAGIAGGSTGGLTNTSALPGMGLMAEGADDLGTTDVRADGFAQGHQGSSTTVGTGSRRSDERADREGVNELAVDTRPDPDQPGLMQRHMNRGGRVWAYRTFEEGF